MGFTFDVGACPGVCLAGSGGTKSTAVSEEAGTIEEVYEPFLIQEGYIRRTPRGREATDLAYRHLGRAPQHEKGTLFDES